MESFYPLPHSPGTKGSPLPADALGCEWTLGILTYNGGLLILHCA